jgi:hypothetical protein
MEMNLHVGEMRDLCDCREAENRLGAGHARQRIDLSEGC